MKTLLPAISASILVASVSPSLAQFTPAEAIEQSQVMQVAQASETRKARKVIVRERAVAPDSAMTIGSAPAKIAASKAAGGRPYDSLIASHASSNGIPAELVHRVIVRESRYRANAMGRGGASGLMQIKLSTARALGYTGNASGLLDPETNLTYGVKYLAGAYRTARGNHGRAVGYYASGYYYAAKRQRAPGNAYAQVAPAAAPMTMMMTDATTSEPIVMQREVRRTKHRR
jgi:soluble lytic murein transglycosylase-like protein